MAPARFNPSVIKNKIKREEVVRKNKRAKNQDKLKKRLERAKEEANDPAARKARQEKNVPRTLDNTREFNPSIMTADPNGAGPSGVSQTELAKDLDNDPFASYFTGTADPTVAPKVLITTSPQVTKVTYTLCEELVGLIPGGEFIRRKKGKGFEMGRIAGWAAGRGYGAMIVVNENTKKPNALTLVHLPNGPTAYFKLTSIQYAKQIRGHARPTDHYPELVLNNFVTRLGHAVGRMFQTLFPQLPEFQGRQVVTLHNQRDFIFLRRHRYAFRSEEKVSLQEIGPRFTLKLRWLKKGIPAVNIPAQQAKPLEFDSDDEDVQGEDFDASMGTNDAEDGTNVADESGDAQSASHKGARSAPVAPPVEDEFEWEWKPELETTRRTFFL